MFCKERRFQTPSFAIATYNAKSHGEPAKWVCFMGIFTIEMNEAMVKLLIEVIDNGGGGEEVELDDDVYDLVEGLESLQNEDKQSTNKQSNDSFSWSRFDTVYTIKCRLIGLDLLREAVIDGADLRNQSLYAFVAETNNVRRAWIESMAARERFGTGA